jgi:DNA-binding transcriptional MocR family regulator
MRHLRAVYTMPTLHNPLGWVLNARCQGRRLASIARQHDLLVIEDAAYVYLVTRMPSPVASYAPERTVYVSGFRKMLPPEYAWGWSSARRPASGVAYSGDRGIRLR